MNYLNTTMNYIFMYYSGMNKTFRRTFSETLLAVLKHRHPELFWENGTINGTKAGRKFGIDQPTFRRWAEGANANNDYVVLMAQKLNLTPAQLRGEVPIPYIDNDVNFKVAEKPTEYTSDRATLNAVPLITLTMAGSWMEDLENIDTDRISSWQQTTAKVSSSAFALRVEGKSMQNPNGNPTVPDGSIVIVEPDIEVTPGRIVVAKLPGSEEVTIKKLTRDGPTRYLESLNPDYKPIQIDESCKIIGVVIQVIIDL
jgi:SOS-response transcriptional repressor LexA